MPLENRLDANEARLFGVLIEKSLTTPDGYPLSVSAATSGANQKSNRSPLMSLTEGETNDALARLVVNGLAGRVVPAGSRVEKYRHNGEERLGLEPAKLAILAELLMRGAQTKGELRTRVNRMRPMPTLETLDAHLAILIKDGWILAVPPAPNSRAGRFAQTMSLDNADVVAIPPNQSSPAPIANPSEPNITSRVSTLEQEVSELRNSLNDLAERLGETL